MNKIVFTNGCFDIIHSGHVQLLAKAKSLGDKLIVGINSDESVKAIKGSDRPILSEAERATILLALESVDKVLIFDEQTPERLIREIGPDILVKGGDWAETEIVGAEFVNNKGGEVHSIPLVEGFSSTSVIDRIRNQHKNTNTTRPITKNTIVEATIEAHLSIFEGLLKEQSENIGSTAEMIFAALEKGGKILLCGNGGSAGDAQHIATELVCRYETERKGYPAIALTTDTSALTAIANDFSFEKVFSRQIESLATDKDILVAISTSGNSPNILDAVMSARSLGCITIGLTGSSGKKLSSLCDASVMVPSNRTARIQEAHITIGHIWCEFVDRETAS